MFLICMLHFDKFPRHLQLTPSTIMFRDSKYIEEFDSQFMIGLESHRLPSACFSPPNNPFWWYEGLSTLQGVARILF
jgi:hypothetical protein